MSANKNQNAAAIPYKQRLIGVEGMLQQGRGRAFEIASQLVAVFDDPQFILDPAIKGDEDEAIRKLDQYAAQLFLILPDGRHPFLDLRAMLAAYPDAAQWRDGQLSEMYDAMLEAEHEAAREPTTKTERWHITRAEHEAVLAELEARMNEVIRLKAALQEAQERIDELESAYRHVRSRLSAENVAIEAAA